MRPRTIAGGLAVVAAVAAVVWLGGRDAERGGDASEGSAPERPAARDDRDAPRASPAEPSAARARDGGTDRAARWRRLLGEVQAAQRRRVGKAASSTEAAAGDVGTLDRHTIQEGIREMKELLAECYENELARTPGLQGRLVVKFALIGEPGVGAIVEEAAVDPDSPLGTNPGLAECVRETIMTLELPAPPQGGRVQVTYPFVFSPGEPDAAP